MKRTSRVTLSVAVLGGGETETALVVGYDFTPGTPETDAGYLAGPAGYDPGLPAALSITSVRLSRSGGFVDAPSWMAEIVRDDEVLRASLLFDAILADEEAKDSAEELRAEERRFA